MKTEHEFNMDNNIDNKLDNMDNNIDNKLDNMDNKLDLNFT